MQIDSNNPEKELNSSDSKYVLHRRFDRMGRLVGNTTMQKLFQSKVMVVGLGGVGSWAAESLVRSGVGQIHLVDFDEICITNSNRQIPALSGNIGKKKASVLAERLNKINPQVKVTEHIEFFNKSTAEHLLAVKPDYIIDAIDNVNSKCLLISLCRAQGIKLITCCGSGGKLDPSQISIRDLAKTDIDPLAAAVRKMLRSEFDFPEEGKLFGIPAVFSLEPNSEPEALDYDQGLGFKCVCPQGANNFHSCERRNVILGSASFVTGTFGFYAVSKIVKHIKEGGLWQ